MAGGAMDGDGARQPLSEKVRAWLSTEGYPLEFRTAAAFRKAGFEVDQGWHVEDGDSVREIDVLAEATFREASAPDYLRVVHVVECKWSRDRPWVVFSGGGGLATKAAIVQTVATRYASTLLRIVSDDPSLQELDIFRHRREVGFGGRQALVQGKDLFYTAIQSVVSSSILLGNWYNSYERPNSIPDIAVLLFPLVVVDGQLFEARYDSKADDIVLTETATTRLKWRGSPQRRLWTQVEITTLDALQETVARRARETAILGRAARKAQLALREFAATGKGFEHLAPTALVRLQQEISQYRTSTRPKRNQSGGPTKG